jgi:xylose isomerase
MKGGIMTNPGVHIFCYAAQVQMVVDINYKLGGSNHVLWSGREGYQSLLNTDKKKECDHMGVALYKLAVIYKEQKGHMTQFLIEPELREPTKHLLFGDCNPKLICSDGAHVAHDNSKFLGNFFLSSQPDFHWYH